jgi:hypothetical protein
MKVAGVHLKMVKKSKREFKVGFHLLKISLFKMEKALEE